MPGRSRTWCFTTNPHGWQHAEPRSKACVCRLRQSGLPHNAELDVSRLPDNVTFSDLQPRMLCTVCDHRGADLARSWLHHA
jgi:hypothetical protein